MLERRWDRGRGFGRKKDGWGMEEGRLVREEADALRFLGGIKYELKGMGWEICRWGFYGGFSHGNVCMGMIWLCHAAYFSPLRSQTERGGGKDHEQNRKKKVSCQYNKSVPRKIDLF